MKGGGSLGFSIIGGTDHVCIPFGEDNPGIFISHVRYLAFNFSCLVYILVSGIRDFWRDVNETKYARM